MVTDQKIFLNDELLYFKNMFNLLLILFAALWYTSVIVTHTHMTLSLWTKVKNSRFESEEVNFDIEVSHVWHKI